MDISSEEDVSFQSKFPLKNINIFDKGSKVERDRVERDSITQTNLSLPKQSAPKAETRYTPCGFPGYEIFSLLNKLKGRSGLEMEIKHNRTLLL